MLGQEVGAQSLDTRAPEGFFPGLGQWWIFPGVSEKSFPWGGKWWNFILLETKKI